MQTPKTDKASQRGVMEKSPSDDTVCTENSGSPLRTPAPVAAPSLVDEDMQYIDLLPRQKQLWWPKLSNLFTGRVFCDPYAKIKSDPKGRKTITSEIIAEAKTAAVEASKRSYRVIAHLAANEDVTIDADSDAAAPRSSRLRPQDMPSTPQGVHVDWHQPLSTQLAGKQTEDDVLSSPDVEVNEDETEEVQENIVEEAEEIDGDPATSASVKGDREFEVTPSDQPLASETKNEDKMEEVQENIVEEAEEIDGDPATSASVKGDRELEVTPADQPLASVTQNQENKPTASPPNQQISSTWAALIFLGVCITVLFLLNFSRGFPSTTNISSSSTIEEHSPQTLPFLFTSCVEQVPEEELDALVDHELQTIGKVFDEVEVVEAQKDDEILPLIRENNNASDHLVNEETHVFVAKTEALQKGECENNAAPIVAPSEEIKQASEKYTFGSALYRPVRSHNWGPMSEILVEVRRKNANRIEETLEFVSKKLVSNKPTPPKKEWVSKLEDLIVGVIDHMME